MKIEVQQKDIDEAVRRSAYNDAEHCPIANAARRAGMSNVRVRRFKMYANNKIWGLPIEASNFIIEFDSLQHVDPISFEVTERE